MIKYLGNWRTKEKEKSHITISKIHSKTAENSGKPNPQNSKGSEAENQQRKTQFPKGSLKRVNNMRRKQKI